MATIAPDRAAAEGERRLAGRHVRLTPLAPGHYDWLYATATSPAQGPRWRLRGAVPRPEQFVDWVWQGVLAQYVVTRVDDDRPLALLQCCDADLRNQHASLTVLVDGAHQRLGWPLEGALLFVDHLFRTWPFRKLYLEGMEANLAAVVSGGGGLFVEEGRLRGHEWFAEAWTDWVTYALYREAFEAVAGPYLEGLADDAG